MHITFFPIVQFVSSKGRIDFTYAIVNDFCPRRNFAWTRRMEL